MARSMVPRGHEVLHHHAMEDVVDANPCVHPECGDGILDPGEACDPLLDPDQTCNADCTVVVCGDGLTQGTEECDDGNTASNDGCSATCTDEPAACGNGVVEHFAGEVCDDSDSAAGDGCGSTCQSNETCGNGFVDTIRGEQCDDGGADYVATLDGAQETPPVVTAATGSATLVLNGDDTLTYDVITTGLTGTMAHIHLGAAGVPGPIIINLVGGPAIWSGTTAPLTAEQKAQLKAGLLYVNVHTAANVNGEIRGQIGFGPTASGDGVQRRLPVERDLRQRRDRRRHRRGLRRRQPRRRRRLRCELPARGLRARQRPGARDADLQHRIGDERALQLDRRARHAGRHHHGAADVTHGERDRCRRHRDGDARRRRDRHDRRLARRSGAVLQVPGRVDRLAPLLRRPRRRHEQHARQQYGRHSRRPAGSRTAPRFSSAASAAAGSAIC